MSLKADWAIRRLEYGDSVEHCSSTMPASHKARQKPRKAQVITAEVWLAVEKAVCAGMGYSQAARAFGIRSPSHDNHALPPRQMADPKPGSKSVRGSYRLRYKGVLWPPNNVGIAMR